MTEDDRRLSTIRALLAKAEATEYPDEAEAFFDKASELISRWAIDEAMLWAGADASGREQPDELQLLLHAPYLPQKAVLVGAVATRARVSGGADRVAARGRARRSSRSSGSRPSCAGSTRWSTSLMVQLTSAMLSRCPSGLTPSASASWRRSFIIGFAEEVGRRLESDRAAAAAERDAAASASDAASRGRGRRRRPPRRRWCWRRAPRRSTSSCAVATRACGRRGPRAAGRPAAGVRVALRVVRRRSPGVDWAAAVGWARAVDERAVRDRGDPSGSRTASALYRCEHLALPDGGRRFRRFAELERFVTEVVLGPWWEQSFPDAPIDVDGAAAVVRGDVLRRAREPMPVTRRPSGSATDRGTR